MRKITTNRFERGILKVIALIGFVRFIIAILLDTPEQDGYTDFVLDIISALVFLTGLILVQLKAHNKWLVIFFYAPLIILLWASFYNNNGLSSAGEINAFAVIIIITLTIQGRLPMVYIGAFLIGLCVILYFVEQENIRTLATEEYNTSTTTLLLVTLANLFMTFHAKNVFDTSRSDLNRTKQNLIDKAEEISLQKEELTKQNHELTILKEELEEKVLERTEKLFKQKEAIEKYLQLTLTELTKPYHKTLSAINNLKEGDDPMIAMVKESGRRLEIEMDKLQKRLMNR